VFEGIGFGFLLSSVAKVALGAVGCDFGGTSEAAQPEGDPMRVRGGRTTAPGSACKVRQVS